MNATMPSPAPGGVRLVSEAFDPAEFVRAAAGWDRGRVESEAERELRAVMLVWDRSLLDRVKPPRGCRPYAKFLERLADWLRTGRVPPFARRDTRGPFLVLAEALARRGQFDPAGLRPLRLPPRLRP
jgi:hypothetical protein